MTSESEANQLKANACLIPRAESLAGNPARGWYFAVLVRASFHRMGGSSE